MYVPADLSVGRIPPNSVQDVHEHAEHLRTSVVLIFKMCPVSVSISVYMLYCIAYPSADVHVYNL